MPITQKLVAGVIVFNTKLDILILQKPNGAFDIPKGHVEHGEILFAAAKRECYEETGLSPNKTFDIYPDIFIDVESKSYVRLYLGVTTSSAIRLSNEHERHYWLDIDSAEEAFEFDGNRDFADAVVKMADLIGENFG